MVYSTALFSTACFVLISPKNPCTYLDLKLYLGQSVAIGQIFLVMQISATATNILSLVSFEKVIQI